MRLALSGIAAGQRKKEPSRFFNVFGKNYYLVFEPSPKGTRLSYGTQKDKAPSHPDEVARPHRLGLDEVARRGADDKLVSWHRSRREKPFPQDCSMWDGYPGGLHPVLQRELQRRLTQPWISPGPRMPPGDR